MVPWNYRANSPTLEAAYHLQRVTSICNKRRHGQLLIGYWLYGSQIYPINFFQVAVVSILLYGCTTWTLTKRIEKKLDGNCTRTLPAILDKSWKQQPTKQPLYGHLPPISKTIQIRWTRHAGHCWRSKGELICDILQWTSSHRRTGFGRPARTYLQQFCEDKWCSQEDQPSAMDDRDEWWERVREICASHMTWWWLMIY